MANALSLRDSIDSVVPLTPIPLYVGEGITHA
jgi:hypothetical protein